jgi:hypothetical protein
MGKTLSLTTNGRGRDLPGIVAWLCVNPASAGSPIFFDLFKRHELRRCE